MRKWRNKVVVRYLQFNAVSRVEVRWQCRSSMNVHTLCATDLSYFLLLCDIL